MSERETAVGIVANPASGRDIRRLVAKASVFPTSEKANMVQRLLTACGRIGVQRAMVSTDLGGISAEVLRAVRTGRNGSWPHTQFCEDVELTDSAADTTNAVQRMVECGADAIICLGGDGTARVAAAACGETPLLPLSTGTNNAFPQIREATVAGMATALIATGQVEAEIGTCRSNVLEVRAGERRELALVDVCASTERNIGSRALWHPDRVTELYCTFAEPDGIGLSSVPGLLCPSARDEPNGVALRMSPAETANTLVHAPIAPGVVEPVGVRDWRTMPVGEQVEMDLRGGVIAVDGERELELHGHQTATVALRNDGPRCVDVRGVLAEAGRRGLLHQDVAARRGSEEGEEVGSR